MPPPPATSAADLYERRNSKDEADLEIEGPSSRPGAGAEAIRLQTVRIQQVMDSARANMFVKKDTKATEMSAADRKAKEMGDIIRAYRGIEADDDDDEGKHWLDGPRFDLFMCAIILLNMVTIGLEMDLGDDSKKGYDRSAIWVLLEWVFCLIFMAEIYLKVKLHTSRWFCEDPWSWLCLVVASLAAIELVILSPLKMSGIRMLSLVRIINLVRLKKLIEKNKRLKELKLVLRGLLGSWVSLLWAMFVLVLIMYVFAIWTTSLIGYDDTGHLDMIKNSGGWHNERLFGSIGRSMFTLLQVMTLDSWSSGVVRYIAVNQWYMVVVFCSFLMLTTYGVINLIISIIVEYTLEASQKNDTRMKAHEEKARDAEADCVREVFLLSDADGNQNLTVQEFREACEDDPEVQWRLRQLEIEPDDVERLFQIMEAPGYTTLSEKEFIDGCTKLKGTAASKDLLALTSLADSMSKRMDLLAKELMDSELMLSRLDTTTTRMTSRFAGSVVHSKRVIHERVRGGAPSVPIPHEKTGAVGEGLLQAGNMPRLPALPNLVN